MTVHEEHIPALIAAKLRRVLKRFQHVLLLKGLTVTVAAFLGSMLVGIGLDRVFLMPDVLRYLISAGALTLTLIAAYLTWLRPALHRPDNVTLAATVESEHPELQERVSSTIEFATTDMPEAYRGSQEMIDAVAEQAKTSASTVNFTDAVSAERARKSSAAAAFLLLLTVCVAVLWWTEFRQLFHRFAMPWANVARVSTYRIHVAEPNKFVERGTSVQITAHVTPTSARRATLYLEDAFGNFDPIQMSPEGEGTFSHTVTNVRRTGRYYVRSGDAITEKYRITAVDQPKRERLDIRYDYPSYTKMKSEEELDAVGDVRGVKGTRVTMIFWINKPVVRAKLLMETGELPLKRVNDTRYEVTMTLTRDDSYVPRFVDRYGFQNHEDERRQIIAKPDEAPKVKILKPKRNLKMHSVESLPVTLEARDDFGVNELAVVYHVNEKKDKKTTLPVQLVQAGSPTIVKTWRWNLRNVRPRLKPGDVVYYRARAVDNRPENPNVGYNSTDDLALMHNILITSPSVKIDRQIRAEQLRRIKQQMKKLKQDLTEAKQQTASMKRLAERKSPLVESQERSKKRAQKKLDDAEPEAKKLAEMLKADTMLERLEPKAREIEKENIPEAKKAAGEIREDRPLMRSMKPLDKANAEIDDALRKLDEMAREIKKLEELEEQERKLAEMADKEDKLAEKAADVAPDQKDKALDLAEQQELLKKMLEQMMDDAMKQQAVLDNLEDLKNVRKDLQNLIDKEKDLKARTEEAMKKKLEELKKRQEDLNKKAEAAKPEVQPKLDARDAGKVPEDEMKKALDAMKKDAFAEAVREQKKAEDQMREQAKALEQPAPKRENEAQKPAAPEEAKQMEDFAKEQEAIRRELAQVAGIPQMDRKMEELARRQEQLKKEAEALEKEAEAQVDKEKPRGEKAPQEMQQALDAMKRQAPQKAPEHQEEAAKELDELARNLEKQADAKKPEAAKDAAKQAEKAKDLAEKQRELKKDLEAALPEKNPEMQQLAADQEEIEQEARELNEELQEIAGAMEEMMPEAGKHAQKAKKSMQKAPEHMQEAAEDLEAAEGEEAKGEEQNAIDAMEEANAEAGKLEQQMADAAESMEGQPELGENSPAAEMAKALGQMKLGEQMMRGLKPHLGQKAMQKAALALAKAAQHAMQQHQQIPGLPKMSLKPEMGNRFFKQPEELKLLKELKLTDEDWAKLPGELKAQLHQAMKGKYPDEYRQVIRDYFRRLAKTGVNGNTGE